MSDQDPREAFPHITDEERDLDFYEECCPDDPPYKDGDYRWYKALHGDLGLEVYHSGDWQWIGLIEDYTANSKGCRVVTDPNPPKYTRTLEDAKQHLLKLSGAQGKERV